MSTENKPKYFITSNLALCGYLEVVGNLRYVKAEITKSNKGKYKVDFYFHDEDGTGSDLEIEYRHSSEKKYRDSLFYYRKIINDMLGT